MGFTTDGVLLLSFNIIYFPIRMGNLELWTILCFIVLLLLLFIIQSFLFFHLFIGFILMVLGMLLLQLHWNVLYVRFW